MSPGVFLNATALGGSALWSIANVVAAFQVLLKYQRYHAPPAIKFANDDAT